MTTATNGSYRAGQFIPAFAKRRSLSFFCISSDFFDIEVTICFTKRSFFFLNGFPTNPSLIYFQNHPKE